MLAPYVPNFWVGFRFAWVATCLLSGTAALSIGTRPLALRVLLGMIAGAVLGHAFSLSISYDVRRDLMLPRSPWGSLEFPVLAIVAGMLSLIPTYHAYRVEERLKHHNVSRRALRIYTGAKLGLIEASVITLLSSPLVFLASKPSYSWRSVPLDILEGPHFRGHIPYFLSLELTLIIAGTLSGAMVGIVSDLQSKDKTP